MYITISGMGHYLGMDVFRLGQILFLEKEESNQHDMEAIKVCMEGGAQIGYVANSTYTRAIGTYSAGYIYRDFERTAKAKVAFITHDMVIAELLVETKAQWNKKREEYIKAFLY